MSKKSLESVLQYLRRVVLTGGANDAHLLERFARYGDEAAFERLVLLHGPMVLGLCQRLLRHEQDAEDAFQATFLTLARKAGTISKEESLGSWLYKVAYRVAHRARGGARETTNRMAILERAGENGEGDVRELRGVLDQEIAALPESYRRSILLCCFQGKTVEEAARRLGCPKATVATWLARGKEQLRRRLSRRGWTLSTGALATVLTDKALAVSLPPGLVGSTLAYLSGKTANAGALSANVFALSEGVLRMLWLNKMKMVAGVVLALVLAGTGIGLIVRQTWAGGGDGQAGTKETVAQSQTLKVQGDGHEGTRAEIADLRKEVAKLREEIKRLSDVLAVGGAKKESPAPEIPQTTLPPPNQRSQDKEKNSIAALFDGIPPDLRSKVQGNSVRGERLNDWLQQNVDGKEKVVKFKVPLRKVGAYRNDDGTYVVHLELHDDSVRLLGGTWSIVAALENQDDVSDFCFQKVSPADAERFVDAKGITIQGTVKRVAATANADWQAPYSILLTLSDVRVDGKAFTPVSGAAQDE
jgi:RNA polymerase sigma factor (sigma-70 family)